MAYNVTSLDNANNIFSTFKAVNELTAFNLLANVILFTIWIVILFLVREFDDSSKFIVASFITSVVAVGFYFTQLVSIASLILPLIILFAAIIYKGTRG